jgi:hypothetical protein
VTDVADDAEVSVKKNLPASSVLGRVAAAFEAHVSEHSKVLPLGVIPGIWVEYEALVDEEADEIRAAAKQRAKILARTRRSGSDDDPEGERAAYAQLLARACVQLVIPTDDPKKPYEPLHIAINREEGGHLPPLRFNNDLLDVLASIDQVPDGLDSESTAVDIVRALHRRGKASGPLLTMGALYDAWRAGVNQAVVAETVGE